MCPSTKVDMMQSEKEQCISYELGVGIVVGPSTIVSDLWTNALAMREG